LNIQPISLMNKVLERNGKLALDAVEILNHAIRAVDPYSCVSRHITLEHQQIKIGQAVLSLQEFKRVFLIGFGKAAVPMAKAMIDILGRFIDSG
jgi:glycerate 2-kinase